MSASSVPPLKQRNAFAVDSPSAMAIAAVILVSLVVIGFLLWPILTGGPTPSQEGSPTAAPSATVEPTPTTAPAPTAVPTPTATVEPTPTPVAQPTVAPVVAWTGLEWSDPVVPFPHEPGAGWPGISTSIDDITWWNDGYIGVGGIAAGGTCSEAAFFRSADGLQWEITHRATSGADRTPTMCPRFIGIDEDGLIALGQERIWRSSDGINWSELDPTGLRELWTSRGEELVDMAVSTAGMIVIGKPMNAYDSIVAFSADGVVWSRIDLPAREQAIAWDVTAWRDRLVIVGRDGRPDEGGSPTEPYIHPGVGAPAAWMSTDGRSWTQADVEGDAVKAGVLSKVVAGSGGLMAIGNDRDVNTQYEEINELGVMAWSSADGSTWQRIGRLDALVPRAWMLESHGPHIVALRDDGAIWISVDGRAWETLPATGAPRVPSFPFLRVQVLPASPQSAWDWNLWVTPTGLVYAGQAEDGWATHAYQVGIALTR